MVLPVATSLLDEAYPASDTERENLYCVDDRVAVRRVVMSLDTIR